MPQMERGIRLHEPAQRRSILTAGMKTNEKERFSYAYPQDHSS